MITSDLFSRVWTSTLNLKQVSMFMQRQKRIECTQLLPTKMLIDMCMLHHSKFNVTQNHCNVSLVHHIHTIILKSTSSCGLMWKIVFLISNKFMNFVLWTNYCSEQKLMLTHLLQNILFWGNASDFRSAITLDNEDNNASKRQHKI